MNVFFNYQRELNANIIRGVLEEIREDSNNDEAEAVADAIDYLNRKDRPLIRQALIDRYATGIMRTRGVDIEGVEDDSNLGTETYVNKLVATMIEQGQAEVVGVGLGIQIAKHLQITTNPTQSWEYVRYKQGDPGEDGQPGKRERENVDAVAEEVHRNRLLGGFKTEFARADLIASFIESGPFYVSYSGGSLVYQALAPSWVHIDYPRTVIDDGVERPADMTQIEDAARVVIQMSSNKGSGQGAADKQTYLAIYGRCEEYPNGRMVTYQATDWRKVPPFGDKDAVERLIVDGKPANPLSVVANKYKGMIGSEYPLVIMRGGHNITSDHAMPINTGLYEHSLEFDTDLSRLVYCAMLNARGTWAVSNPGDDPLPRNIEGVMSLAGEQSILALSQVGINVKYGMDALVDTAKLIGGSHGVPDHMIGASMASAMESGIAIYLKSQPFKRQLDYRVDLNAQQVAKIFAIERGLLLAYRGDGAPGELRDDEIDQVWNPGRYVLPEDPQAKFDRLKKELDAGAISYVRFIRDLKELATDNAAKEYIQNKEGQDAEHPKPSVSTPRQPLGGDVLTGLRSTFERRPAEAVDTRNERSTKP